LLCPCIFFYMKSVAQPARTARKNKLGRSSLNFLYLKKGHPPLVNGRTHTLHTFLRKKSPENGKDSYFYVFSHTFDMCYIFGTSATLLPPSLLSLSIFCPRTSRSVSTTACEDGEYLLGNYGNKGVALVTPSHR
jgi:hypothetical protein